MRASKLLRKPRTRPQSTEFSNQPMMCAADFMRDEAEHVTLFQSWLVGFNRMMTVVELDYGVVVETQVTDENEITLTETLFSTNRKVFTLIGRWRVGTEHSEWQSYPRDSFYPMREPIRL